MPINFPQHPGLVAYLTAGDPDLATTRDIALALLDNGADVLELGVPFSDPLADGPVIQRASQRAVQNGTRLTDVLSLAKELRHLRPNCGLVLFSYLNPVMRMCQIQAQRYETVHATAEAEGKYVRSVGGAGNYGHVILRVAPGDSGHEFTFADESPAGAIPSRYLPAIQTGVREALRHGVLSGGPLVNVKVTLLGGTVDEVSSNDLSFQIAASMALKNAARMAKPTSNTPVSSMSTFCVAAADAGLDGVLLTDMIVEEATEYLDHMHANALAPVFLAAPTSPDTRLRAIAEASRGFVYAISRTGITGTQTNAPADDAQTLVARLRQFTEPRNLPIAVGFGISTPAHVRAVAEFADAAVIGSAIVALIEQTTPAEAPATVGRFLRSLRP